MIEVNSRIVFALPAISGMAGLKDREGRRKEKGKE